MNTENLAIWAWYGLLFLMVAVPVVKRWRAAVKLSRQDQLLEMQSSWMAEVIEVVYPGEARRRGLEGAVVVEIEFDGNGKAVNEKLIQSSNIETLDLSVLKAVSKSKLVPGEDLSQQLKVTFKLNDA